MPIPPLQQTPADFAQMRDWLAQRLDCSRLPAGGDVHTEDETTPAAVLVPIVLRADGPTVLLTKRTDHLAKHAGQISFPGGRCEYEEDAETAALRETEEEIGISAHWITPVGRLPQYTTITRYRVTPVVALLQAGFALQLQSEEVAEAFEVPLRFLLDRTNFQERTLNFPERRAVTYALNWQGKIIWGATAGMLMMLYQTLIDEDQP